MLVCIHKPLADNNEQVTARELCTIWADTCLACGGVPSLLGGGGGGASLGDHSTMICNLHNRGYY